MSWYWVFAWAFRAVIPFVARIRVHGSENVPASGPFILVANHESVFDPLIIQSRCHRVLHTFTKSSQFKGRVWRWVLPRVRAFPVRRYQVDPQAVRIALRRLDAGEGVGVFPEGERAWDGMLQPFRRGTIRLLLRTGVPVIPAWISGSYDVWPRWSHRFRRGNIHVRFGEPLDYGVHDSRPRRDAALESAEARLRSAMLTLANRNAHE